MSKVILYHQDGCPQCRMVEMLLEKYGVEFESCKDMELMKERGILTPTLEVDGTLLTKKPMIDWVNSHRS